MRFCSAMLMLLSVGFSQMCTADQTLSPSTRHLAYLSMLHELKLKGYDQPNTVEYVSSKMNLSVPKARSFLEYTKNSYHQLEQNRQEVAKELLCPENLNRQYISENSGALTNTIRDIEDSHLFTIYSSVLNDFDKATFNRLNLWLDTISRSSGINRSAQRSSVNLFRLEDYMGICNQMALTNH